jgi:protein-S-isoprenylcysteine O-methyltransferase Ste14
MTISFWVILLAMLAYGLLHSFLASRKFKSAFHSYFGPAGGRWFRLGYNLVAVISLLPILLLTGLLPDRHIYTIPYPWVIISTLCQLVAVIGLLIGLQQTGVSAFLGLSQYLGGDNASQNHLVTKGLYQHVRHPLYSAGLIIIWLTPILTWNVLAINLGLSLYIFIGGYFEEQKMLLEFGLEYEEYRRCTPMLVPGLRISHIKHN